MAHCPGRGDEILVGDLAHIIMWEQGGVAQVAGVHSRQVCTNPDGTLDLLDVENKIRSRDDAHVPTSRLICIEQTHNGTGGRVLPLDYLRKVMLVKILSVLFHVSSIHLHKSTTGHPPFFFFSFIVERIF